MKLYGGLGLTADTIFALTRFCGGSSYLQSRKLFVKRNIKKSTTVNYAAIYVTAVFLEITV